jgi:putative membrane protein
MKKGRLLYLLFSVSLALTMGCSSPDKEKPADEKVKKSVGDSTIAKFLTTTARACMSNLKHSAVAMERASNPSLRDIGAKVNSHQKVFLNEMRDLAKSNNVTLPDSSYLASNKRILSYDSLQPGDELDRRLLMGMTGDLSRELRGFDLIKTHAAAEIKAFVSRNASQVQMNYDSLRTIRVARPKKTDRAARKPRTR